MAFREGTYQGQDVTILREAVATDKGYAAVEGRQVFVRMPDGDEKAVLMKEMKKGWSEPKPVMGGEAFDHDHDGKVGGSLPKSGQTEAPKRPKPVKTESPKTPKPPKKTPEGPPKSFLTHPRSTLR